MNKKDNPFYIKLDPKNKPWQKPFVWTWKHELKWIWEKSGLRCFIFGHEYFICYDNPYCICNICGKIKKY